MRAAYEPRFSVADRRPAFECGVGRRTPVSAPGCESLRGYPWSGGAKCGRDTIRVRRLTSPILRRAERTAFSSRLLHLAGATATTTAKRRKSGCAAAQTLHGTGMRAQHPPRRCGARGATPAPRRMPSAGHQALAAVGSLGANAESFTVPRGLGQIEVEIRMSANTHGDVDQAALAA
jgi:hypothetical protein